MEIDTSLSTDFGFYDLEILNIIFRYPLHVKNFDDSKSSFCDRDEFYVKKVTLIKPKTRGY